MAPYPLIMDVNTVLAAAAVLAVAAVAVLVVRGRAGGSGLAGTLGRSGGIAPEDIVAVLPSASILIDEQGRVCKATAQALALQLATDSTVAVPQIRAMVDRVRRDGIVREGELTVDRPPPGKGDWSLRVRVAPLAKFTVVMAEDLSESQRVEAVRRDFVANVSHELKTPIGALSLLAEAVLSAADEPDAVRHFATRMASEADRLSALVSDLIDLSRLQGADPLKQAEPVLIDHVVAEAMDATRLLAESGQIQVVVQGRRDLTVFGVEPQLVTALRNLLSNAVNYSARGTRITVSTEMRQSVVEISVSDQGMGIPDGELDRVFERFYRVDQARSRQTGGTGLGLAIVKHVCENHAGEVAVASVLGEGSIFTLRLPAYRDTELAVDATTHREGLSA